MEIAYLAEYPEHLPVVASWVYYQWGARNPANSLEKVEAKFRTHLRRDGIPLTVIALVGQEPAGAASLVVNDMSIRTELSPWLAAAFVPEAYRNQGIGSALVQAVEQEARRLKVARLYLYTPDREGFYTRLGWRDQERLEYHGRQVALMTKAIDI